MNIFGMTFLVEKANLLDVIKGCGLATLDFFNAKGFSKQNSEVAEYRRKICMACPLGQVNNVQCYRSEGLTIPHAVTGLPIMGCTCLLACKLPLLHEHCPAGKWSPVDEE